MTYKEIVLNNFKLYDKFLTKYESSKHYDILLAIRTYYCAHTLFKSKRLIDLLKQLIKNILYIITIPIFESFFSKKNSTLILKLTKHDDKLSKLVDIHCEYPIFKISFSFKSLKWLFLYIKVIKICYLLLKEKNLETKNVIYIIPILVKSIVYYYKTDFTNIHVIITEDDISYSSAALILKARSLGVTTIKIEHFFIDDIHHNNVACEYYFCPNNFYKKIREQCRLNKHLNYLSGGLLIWDILADYSHQPLSNPKLITFFTQHSDHLKSKNEIFYIDEILSVMSSEFKLIIKVHPFEKIDKYEKYKSNPNCKIIMFGEVDNYVLISQSTFCFSIFSILSFEAKHILEKSFFINYEPTHPNYTLDYNDFNSFFDLIKNRDELQDVLNNKVKPISKEKFISNFNPHFPTTRNIFLEDLIRIENTKK